MRHERKKANVTVLNKDDLRIFLERASENNWYLEILLGLFMGLRKGEIAGLKYADFILLNDFTCRETGLHNADRFIHMITLGSIQRYAV